MIGVFDSGSGGLTILSQLQRSLPFEKFLYLGDHARNPYGDQSSEQIIQMTKEMVEYLFNHDCDLVVLACNTASTIALRHLQENWLPHAYPHKRILGVHIPVVEALTGLAWEREGTQKNLEHTGGTVLVFATTKTVQSGTYSRQVKLRAPNYNIIEQACPHLAQAIEQDPNSEHTHQLVREYIKNALEQSPNQPEAVILGCTHYPLVEHIFKENLGGGIQILNQPKIVAQALSKYLIKHPQFGAKEKTALTQYMTTGKPEDIVLFPSLANEAPHFKAV